MFKVVLRLIGIEFCLLASAFSCNNTYKNIHSKSNVHCGKYLVETNSRNNLQAIRVILTFITSK